MSGTITALVQSIKDHLEKADNSQTRSVQHFIAAGKLLKELKERKPENAEWGAYVRSKFNIGKSRANDLIAMAEGRTTVEEVRQSSKERVQKTRARRPLRSGREEPEEPRPRAKPRASDPIQEDCGEECANDEERWQRSLSSLAGDAVSLEAFWTREFGDQWKNFKAPSSLVTLARQAAKSWTDLAAKLANK